MSNESRTKREVRQWYIQEEGTGRWLPAYREALEYDEATGKIVRYRLPNLEDDEEYRPPEEGPYLLRDVDAREGETPPEEEGPEIFKDVPAHRMKEKQPGDE
jgi:hypothetical protein